MKDSPAETVSITAVGDLMLDRRLLPPRLFFYQPEGTDCFPSGFACRFPVPFVNSPRSRAWLEKRERSVHGVDMTSHSFISVKLPLPPEADLPDFPFDAITAELRRSDITFGNLENPLTDRGRRGRNDNSYRASPAYAPALRRASFDVLSCANNHAMDYGEVGLEDTLAALRSCGIAPVGAGASEREARSPAIVEARGVRVAFLAYTMVASEPSYAVDDEAGVAPLNPMVAEQDIASAREQADCVLVSVHWGIEQRPIPAPELIQLGRFLIDAGADGVLGHHAHVPGSIEVYRNKPILYSLGNFSFGHDHSYWSHDIVARLVWSRSGWRDLEVRAVGGRFQPALLPEPAAAAVYRGLQEASTPFGTEFRLERDAAYVSFADGS